MHRHFKTTGIIFLVIFALIGFAFTAVFVAMQFGWLNVRGTITERNKFFGTTEQNQNQKNTGAKDNTNPPPTKEADTSCIDKTKQTCSWNETREWSVVSGGLTKDKDIIARVSAETGVSPRLLATIVVPEQTRFFTAEREVFKRYFEPLKILGSLSKFSLGISGIKQETAMLIEKYASDETTAFYPGKQYAPLLAYNDQVDHDKELYNRLTDPKNHYYSYLYTAIFVKEIEAQWTHDGYDISTNPGAIVTLFNLGFSKSHPNPLPHQGGAQVETGGQTYSYGELGALFYSSDELTSVFPK